MTRLNCSSPHRPRTPGRLSASTSRPVWLRRSWPVVSSDAIRCSSCALDSSAPALRLLDLAIDLIQRFRDRREQVLHRLFAGVDIGGRLRAGLAQTGFGEIEKRLVVGFQGLGGQRLEGFTQRPFGFVVRLEPLGVHGAVLVELVPKLRLRGTAGQPSHQRADGQTDRERDDQGDGFDGH